jgi:hypothetical protein
MGVPSPTSFTVNGAAWLLFAVCNFPRGAGNPSSGVRLTDNGVVESEAIAGPRGPVP